jgi:peptidyl-prolyl cis-trans isomerase D
MLSFFRQALGSKIAVGILALVVIAFILTGVVTREMSGTTSLSGASGGTVAAKVGDRTITVPDVSDRVQRQVAAMAQQQPGLTVQAAVLQGGVDSIFEQMINEAALEQFAQRIGIVASKKQIDGEIAGIPAFAGPDGKFNRQAYLAVLAQQHIAEPKLRDDIGRDLVRRSIILPVTGAVTLADGVVRPYAGLLTEVRQGSVGFVPAAAITGGAAPTPAELQAFYKAHIAAYTQPEQRVLRYAVIGRDQVAAGAIPSEAQIRNVYDSAPQTYAAHETRALSQVVLPDEAKAKAFKASIAGGKSFADAAKAAGFGEKDIAVGTKSQADYAALSSPAVAAAAFALAQGGVSDPVKSDFGWHVVKVDAVNKIAAIPYETARPQIAGDLGKQMQDKALADLVNKTQDALEAGKSFADTARAEGLTVVETPALTQAGAAAQPGYKPTPEVIALLKPGFASAPDQPASIETIQPKERYALLAVGRVIPAAPIPFAQAAPRVTADFTAVRAADRAKAIADAIVAKVKGGATMAAAFAAAPVKLPPVQDGKARRIDLARAQGEIPVGLKTLFTLVPGRVKAVADEQGRGWYVVRLNGITPGDPAQLAPLIAQSKSELTQSASDEYIQELGRAAGKDLGVTRNPTAIAELKRQLLAGATPAADQ